MGEETDGVVESTSKLQEKIKALSGVDILTNAGDYKDTYTILKEIGQVWEDMSDIDQAALLELMAGKNRANTLSAILSNMKDLEGAYETALGAEGSALKENEAYLDSIQGRIDLFNNAFQSMWMNFTNSDVIKFVIDVGTGLVKAADSIGVIKTALGGIIAYLTVIKKKQWFDFSNSESLFGNLNIFKKGGLKNRKNKATMPVFTGYDLLEGDALTAEINKVNAAADMGQEEFGKYLESIKDTNTGMYQYASNLKGATATTEGYNQALQNQSRAALETSQRQKKLNMAVGLSMAVLTIAISAIQEYVRNLKNIEEEYETLQSNMSDIESDITSLESELEAIGEQIDALSNKNLTIAEAEELRKLKQQTAELERQKELREATLATYESQNQRKTLEMYNNALKTTSAEQKKAAESGKLAGQIIGGVASALLVLGGVALAAWTGGASVAAAVTASGTLMAATGAATVGSQLGGAWGERIWSNGKSVDNLTEWYDSYIDAIAEAEAKASKAESKYWSNMTDKNYDSWQKKLDASNHLKEDLYNNLEEMQGYISQLEYNDQTKATIDEFNKLQAHISITSMDGDIDAQVSSIEALKKEYAELSKGVDEHGNNIALTAEEYARYQAIITQVLGYNVGLTQTFTENGSAIYDASGNLVNYNAVLSKTISLLKEQQKQAAITAIEGENSDNKPLFDAYKAAQKYDADSKIKTDGIKLDGYKLRQKEMADIIGVKNKGSFEDFVYNNADLISQNMDAIIAKAQESRNDVNIEYYKQYLESVISYANSDILGDKFKETLSIVPQLSDAYDDLSGSQLAFVNSYISSLEIAKNASKEDITQIKNDIVGLVDTIGASEGLQESINNLIALDPSSMPVDAYVKKFNDLWWQVASSIPEDQRTMLYEQLFPDQSQIKTMVKGISAELDVQSRGLVNSLSLEELRVAYKLLPEYDNNYDEALANYKQIVAEREAYVETLSKEERYWGNVDQYARNILVVTDDLVNELKSKDLIPIDWEKADIGNYMTTFGMDDEISEGVLSGQRIMYTPILPNGELLDRATIDQYLYEITKDASSLEDVLKADQNGLKIGKTWVNNIVNGITNVDDKLINSTLDSIFADIDDANIKQYSDDVNKIVTDNLVSAFNITDGETIDVLSESVSSILTDAINNADPDANIKDIIDSQAYDLAMTAATSASYSQHVLQAEIYDKEYEALSRLNKEHVTFSDLQKLIAENIGKSTGPLIESYDTLKEQTAQYNEVLSQTSDIVFDNTKITQEYKDSLSALGISEEELATCFDKTNKLVVTNAKKLNDLVKGAKKNTAQNIQLAKSQARLQYYELYKKMAALVDAKGRVSTANAEVILGYHQELNALEKSIAKYSMLEAQLLGTANAYEKFKEAQEIDSETNYIGGAEEMVLALGQAFNTAELGSETAQAAIAGLVPESVYEDLDTVEEKMAAIYEYFKNGDLSHYFTLEYDDDGNITSAEMKLGNLRKFIEDGLGSDKNEDGVNPLVYKEGYEDWQHFELNQDWLKSLPNGTDILQAFADQMGVTKDMAFAFIKSFKDHDIEWLDGDYSTFFDQMMTSTNEGKMQLYTEYLADTIAEEANLKQQLDEGKISVDEYNTKLQELQKTRKEYNTQLTLAQNASKRDIFGKGSNGQADYQLKTSSEVRETENIDDLDNWLERNEKVNQLYEEQAKAQEELNHQRALYDAAVEKNGGSTEGIDITNLTKAEQKWLGITSQIAEATAKRDEFTKPTVLEVQIILDELETKIEETRVNLDEKLSKEPFVITVDGNEQSITSTEKMLDDCFHIDEDGYWTINAEFNNDDFAKKYPEMLSYVDFLNSNTRLTAYLNGDEVVTGTDELKQLVNDVISAIEENLITLELDEDAVQNIVTQANKIMDGLITNFGITISATMPEWVKSILRLTGWSIPDDSGTSKEGGASVNGTAHVHGTARASGDWGLPTNEHDALVGELGQEMVVDPSTGRYYTVGDTGAEMVDLPKGAIIFNHKQTESLLKNGYVTSRGKAYAEGNAHVTIWPNASSKSEWDGTGYSGPDGAWSELNNAASSLSNAADSADEFNEIFDWIEVRLEELEEKLSLFQASIENATTVVDKNNIIDKMINVNNVKLDNLAAGYNEYSKYADSLLTEVPEKYRDAAQNGAIAIEKFVGEADETTLEAIQNYREWVQKAADLKQQMEEVVTAIRDLAIERIDNAQSYGDIKTTVEDSQNEKLQNAIDLIEAMGKIPGTAYYGTNAGQALGSTGMFENSYKKIEYLGEALETMQAELNKAVENGELVRGTVEWYEQIDKLYQVQSEIAGATKELEEFQNAINDLHWENFDQLINRLDYIESETQSLVDLMANDDLVGDPAKSKYENGTVEYWNAEDVKYTKEGIASLGLYAQQMELAEFRSKQYAEAIDDLTADYNKGLYSENEYLEKLNELKEAQYESIEAYYDAQDAIKELNEARIDSIKEGIEKEIEAYEELIEAKKEALSSEKDLYDFQKQTMEQEKNIADIERKLAALAYDTSLSAAAQRKRLEAELAEANAELQESYYNRSIEDQQNALDQELEDFNEAKDAEITKWEEYAEDIKQVITDSLALVQANATGIYDTLSGKAEEYNLTLSDSITTPWQDGALAVDEYQETFGNAMSSTMDQLEVMKQKWQEVIAEMERASKVELDAINKQNADYAAATKKEPVKPAAPSTSTNQDTTQQSQETPKPSLTKGSYVEVKPGTRWYANSAGGGPSGNAKSGTIKYVNNNGAYAYNIDGLGWIKKSDIVGYKSGTTGVKNDQLAWIDEMGLEELVMHAGPDGRLQYLSKGSAVIPHDITKNLMEIGQLDPSMMIDQNRPAIGASHVVNNEISITMDIAEVVHIDKVTNDTIPDLTKAVQKQMDSYMSKLNNAIKSKVR